MVDGPAALALLCLMGERGQVIREGAAAQRIQIDLHLKFSLIVKYSVSKGHSSMSKGGGKN